MSDLPFLSWQPSSVLQADSLDADAGQAMNIDLSSVTEATINAEGHLVLNGVGDDAGKERLGHVIELPWMHFEGGGVFIMQVLGIAGSFFMNVNQDNHKSIMTIKLGNDTKQVEFNGDALLGFTLLEFSITQHCLSQSLMCPVCRVFPV